MNELFVGVTKGRRVKRLVFSAVRSALFWSVLVVFVVWNVIWFIFFFAFFAS